VNVYWMCAAVDVVGAVDASSDGWRWREPFSRLPATNVGYQQEGLIKIIKIVLLCVMGLVSSWSVRLICKIKRNR
jgi:hypothetical protein